MPKHPQRIVRFPFSVRVLSLADYIAKAQSFAVPPKVGVFVATCSPLPSLSRRARGGLEPPGRTTLSLSLSLVLETTVFVKTLREETRFILKEMGGGVTVSIAISKSAV